MRRVRTSEVQNRDKEFSRYLMENAGQDLVACLFLREDTLQDQDAGGSLEPVCGRCDGG